MLAFFTHICFLVFSPVLLAQEMLLSFAVQACEALWSTAVVFFLPYTIYIKLKYSHCSMPYLHKKQMEPIAFSFAPCFLQSVVCAEDCCKSGLSSVSEVLERALSPHSLLHQTQAAQRGTLIYFMEYYFLCVTMAAAIKRSPSHRYYLILHIHTHADSHTHTQTHTQAKEESLLIFISHMFSSQREKLTYREVITVTQREGGGLHHSASAVQKNVAAPAHFCVIFNSTQYSLITHSG